ncbi:YceD family protein [Nocardia rhizosphaerihabitans]|uniref:YceD family protein n=1 Tax=Nocardia rhizosphaerihabitans TaxID=1691570 RepID=UPI00366BEBCC
MPAASGSPSRPHKTSGPVSDAGFVLDVRSLGRRPGTMRELRRTVTDHARLGLDLIAIPADAAVELDLQLQAVSEGVLVTGTASGPTVGECSRCLEPFDDQVEIRLTELFAYPDSTTEQTTEDDEVYRMEDDLIDLEPVILDAIGLELPLQPLCTPDCAGLCPECGVRMAIAGPDHGHEILDPRWAKLASFAAEAPGTGDPAEGSTTPDRSAPVANDADVVSENTEEK